jgi:hypothetical protein
MLNAEIHGHSLRQVENNEDYLTSAVFEHLRYVPPSVFWPDLFSRALGLPECGIRRSLLAHVCQPSDPWRSFDSLEVIFWPSHPSLGTPDLMLVFKGAMVRPFILIIEAKLWSPKSGTGRNDQLLRYLSLLTSLGPLALELGTRDLETAVKAVVYLKPSDPLPEMLETAMLCGEDAPLPPLFGLEWQDIVEAANRAIGQSVGIVRLVLSDVALFLKHRGLEYFKGFRTAKLSLLTSEDGSFYCASARSAFTGLSIIPLPNLQRCTGAFYLGGSR